MAKLVKVIRIRPRSTAREQPRQLRLVKALLSDEHRESPPIGGWFIVGDEVLTSSQDEARVSAARSQCWGRKRTGFV